MKSFDFPEDDVGVIFRHTGWTDRRKCVVAALEKIDESENRLARFRSCGRNAWVLRSLDDPDVFRIACDKCKDRFCSPCASERARHIASCVAEYAVDRELRLITLTLKKTDNTIAEDVDRIYKAFTRLRRRVLWSSTQRGGVFFVEIKRRRGDDGWHTHLHVLSEGRWIDKKKLSTMWFAITGDSFIVDVKWCDSGPDAARYVAKYAGKGVHGSCYHDPNVLREAVVAIKGRRLVGKWGTWRDLDLNSETEEGEWIGVDSLSRLYERSRRGDQIATGILDHLKGGEQCPAEQRGPPDLGESPFLFA